MDPAPFDLAGHGAAAALCLHGLTGTPYEVRPLGEAFAKRGIRAFGPTLPGHNATPEELARVPHDEWVECARTHLRELRAAHERVFLVGVSMGGLVSLLLCAEEGADACVVVGVPLRLHPAISLAIPLLKYLKPLAPKHSGSDIRDTAARARHPSYPVMPLAAVHELMRLQRRVRAGLPDVRAPLLVAHGAHDATAPPKDAREIVESVSSEHRELLMLESSAHVVPVDHDGEALAAAATDFLARCM